MNRKLKMDGDAMAATADIRRFPGMPVMAESEDKQSHHRPGFWRQRLIDIGVLAMPENRPPGFYVNWASVTGIIAIISVIAGLYVFVARTSYEQGRQEQEKIEMQRQLEEQKSKLAEQERLLKLAVNPPEEKKK